MYLQIAFLCKIVDLFLVSVMQGWNPALRGWMKDGN